MGKSNRRGLREIEVEVPLWADGKTTLREISARNLEAWQKMEGSNAERTAFLLGFMVIEDGQPVGADALLDVGIGTLFQLEAACGPLLDFLGTGEKGKEPGPLASGEGSTPDSSSSTGSPSPSAG